MSILDKMKVVAWNIGFIEQDVKSLLVNNEYSIVWLKHNYHDRFFADPFLLEEKDNRLFVLAEEYFFSEGKGRIVKLCVDKNTKELLKNERLIETDYHLSYPFVYGNEIIVEQAKSGKWIAYDKQGEKSRTLSDMGLIDSTILFDGKTEWVFATKIVEDKGEALRKVYRYKIVNGFVDKSSEIIIKDDLVASRPGGNFFKIDGTWYRAAQTSTEQIYGESITICKIIENTDETYKEEPVKKIISHNEARFNMGLHTFNPYDGFVIVDGFEMQIHPFQKLKYKLRRQ